MAMPVELSTCPTQHCAARDQWALGRGAGREMGLAVALEESLGTGRPVPVCVAGRKVLSRCKMLLASVGAACHSEKGDR